MPEKLTPDARARDLPALAARGWRAAPEGDALMKVWKCADFSEAWGFMTRVALAAEKAGHHPDWSNSYSRVEICLSSHDCGGLSERDLALAARIDALAPFGARVLEEGGTPISRLLDG